MPIHIDREIAAIKPDIIIRDQTTKKCQMINMAVKSDSDTSFKVVEKLSKYKDLELEIPRMWKRETQKILVLLGCLGSLRRDWKSTLTEFQDRIPGTTSSPHPQRSVKQARGYNNSIIIIIIIVLSCRF